MRISDWSSDVCSSDLAKSAVLEHAERRGELVQFGHAVGARALEADDDDHVAIEFAGLEGILHLLLIAEHARGRLDRPRSEEQTSELQSLMRISYAVFCLNKTNEADLIHDPNTHDQTTT